MPGIEKDQAYTRTVLRLHPSYPDGVYYGVDLLELSYVQADGKRYSKACLDYDLHVPLNPYLFGRYYCSNDKCECHCHAPAITARSMSKRRKSNA